MRGSGQEGIYASCVTIAMTREIIHFGPIYGRPEGETLALCSPRGPSLMSSDESAVTCEACLGYLEAMQEGEAA